MRKRLSTLMRFFHPTEIYLFVLLLILLLWSLIAFDLHRIHDSSMNTSKVQLRNLTRVYAEEVTSSINTIDYVLLDLRDQWNNNPTEFAAKVQEREIRLDPSVAFNVGIINQRGTLIFSSYDWNIKPIDLSDREHFRFHLTNGGDALFISKPVVGRAIHRWSIQFTRPLPKKNGRFNGEIVLSVSPEYFSRFHQNIELGEHSSIALSLVTGELLSRSPNPDLALGKTIADAPFLTAKPVESGFFQKRSEVDNVERLYAWHVLEHRQLAVIIGQSTATIFKQYHQQRALYFWSGGVISLLLLVAGFFIFRYLRQRTQDKAAIEKMEKALQHTQKMEALGNLTGGVAHDFNNILQIISGNTQLLKIVCSGDAHIEERLDNTLDAVDRGAKLSSQLLTFARRQPLRPATVHLGKLIKNIDGLIQGLVGSAIEIHLHIPENLWNVRIDPNFLENIILNLAANARDAMQGKGTLTIKLANTSVDTQHSDKYPGIESGDYVSLAITDTGSGMGPEIIGRVFEPFFTTKPEGKGTGLGLAMAYGFIRESGGRIYIESEVAAGTTILIFLPRTADLETTIPAIFNPTSLGGTETILLVDDDIKVQAATASLLTELGYQVLTANDAEDALDILKKNEAIDVLFTDVAMPGPMNGSELAKQAKSIRPDLAVLLTSGYIYDVMNSDQPVAQQLDILKKPYRREELDAAIRQVFLRDTQ